MNTFTFQMGVVHPKRHDSFANRFTGSRFAVNVSRYTGNLINHLLVDGNANWMSICKTLAEYLAIDLSRLKSKDSHFPTCFK